VWFEMNKVWKHVEDLRDTFISVIQSKKIEESAKNAQNELNKLPNNMKSYEAYEQMKNRIKSHSKMNKIIVNIKTEAMK
jgi:dynein heavy chain 1